MIVLDFRYFKWENDEVKGHPIFRPHFENVENVELKKYGSDHLLVQKKHWKKFRGSTY